MAKFKKKAEEEKRSVRKEVLFTTKEWEKIEEAARVRILDPSDYIRRAALNRRADVRVEERTVLALSQNVQELRRLHKVLETASGGVDPIAKEILKCIETNFEALLWIKNFHH